MIPIDYTYLPKSEEGACPIFVGHDDQIRCVAALVVPGNRDLLTVSQRLVQWTGGLGHGNVIWKSGQEFAIVDLQLGAQEEVANALEEISKHVKSLRGMDVEMEGVMVAIVNSPVVGHRRTVTWKTR